MNAYKTFFQLQKFGVAVLLSLSAAHVAAQDDEIIMPRTNNFPGFEEQVSTCDATFYDAGGINEAYPKNQNGIITICPTNSAEKIKIVFTLLDIKGNDFLTIYDGSSTSDPVIETITNAVTIPDEFFYASLANSTGCLTFTFTSDQYNGSYQGWVANVSCFNPCDSFLTNPITLENCPDNESGLAIFDLTLNEDRLDGELREVSVSYFLSEEDALENRNAIANPTNYETSSSIPIFTRSTIENDENCVFLDQFDLRVLSLIPDLIPDQINFCQGDQTVSVDTIVQLQGTSDYRFEFYPSLQDQENNTNAFPRDRLLSDEEELFITVFDQGSSCKRKFSSLLKISSPFETDLKDRYFLCLNQDGNRVLTVNTGLSTNDYQFQWYAEDVLLTETTGTIELDQPGNYRLAVLSNNNDCTQIYEFEVLENFQEVDRIDIQNETFSRSIEVSIASNTLEAQVFLNDQIVQLNDLNDLENGFYNIKVQVGNCLLLERTITINAPPRFFTPNNDSYNDSWMILSQKSNVEILNIAIFDRFGALLSVLPSGSTGWQGVNSSGRPMPPSDYWYTINYLEDGEQKQYKSHFSLKR